MNILAFDIGTYSIKIVEAVIERKQLYIESLHQVVLSEFRDEFPPEITEEEIQQEIVLEYLKKRKFDGKIIYQLPAHTLTCRLLNFPVKNKKKAELMIPFQLDKDLLFTSANAHYGSQLIQQKESVFAVLSIIELAKFDSIYKTLETTKTLPNILTSELSLFQSYILLKKKDENFCIVDLGHSTTKAYFVNGRKIISAHISHVAGKVIEETLAETYMISLPEAREFKHQKAFLLTDQQILEVDEEQQEFAILMKKIFVPLITDLKRWELGYRVKMGKKIDHIYLCGGTSNIRNIDNFLTIALSIKTEQLEVIEKNSLQNVNLSLTEKSPYTIANLMAMTAYSKYAPLNFRTKQYSQISIASIPLHSAAFIGVRILIITFFISISMVFEHVLLAQDSEKLNRGLKTLLKSEQLQLSPSDRGSRLRKNPKGVFKKVKSRLKNAKAEGQRIEDILNINAINPLMGIGQIVKGQSGIELLSFENLEPTEDSFRTISASFKVETAQQLKKLKNKFGTSNLPNLKVTEDIDNLTLNILFEE